MRTLSLLLLLCTLSVASFAGILKGKVTDKKGEPLPFATVYLEGTTIGTSANADGDYQLSLQPGSYTVVCQYIGYRQSSFPLTISGNETSQHNFSLEEQGLDMKEVVVKASEDPALYIMRKVIEKRKFHEEQVRSFQTGIYLKGMLKTRQTPKKLMGEKIDPTQIGLDSSGKGFLYLCEQFATYYADADEDRTVIHSVRESGNPNGMGFAQFPSVVSFYQNNIHISPQIAPRGFISPVSENALYYYKYRLDGDFREAGHTIYKIRVTPKRKYEPVFEGDLYIVDNEWAIHSLNMLVTKTSNMQLLDTLRIEQVYLPLQPDLWVIKQQVLYPAIKIFGFDITGNFVTVYNDQVVNGKLPDSIFKGKIVSRYDAEANKRDTAYWAEKRPVPLEEDELKDYVIKDSVRLRFEDPHYRDSIRRRNNRPELNDLLVTGYNYTGRDEKFYLNTNSLLTGLLNYNTVEGTNIDLRTYMGFRLDSFRAVTLLTGTRYGFENEHFNAIARVGLTQRSRTWMGRAAVFGAEGGKYVYQFNPNNPIDALYNSFATLLYRQNYLKIYERWNFGLFYRKNFGNGLRWNTSLTFQQRLPLENTTDFSFAKGEAGGFTPNMPESLAGFPWEEYNAVIAKLEVSYQPGFTYVQYPDYKMPNGSRMPVFTASFEKGVPYLLDSKADFDKWRFSVRDNFSLKLLGTMSYNLATGGFLNTTYVSIPDLNHLNGNELFLASRYLESFQLAPYYKFSNREPWYGEAHLEWHMNGFLSNKIPLFRQMRWYFVAGANGYYANDNLYHIEGFAGIDNLGYDKFRILRLDFVHSWNSLHQQSYALRLGLNLSSGITVTLRDADTEW